MIKNTLQRIKPFVLPYAHNFIWIILMGLLTIGLTLYTPVMIGRAVDSIGNSNGVDYTALINILLRLALIISVNALCQWLLSHMANIVGYKTAGDMRIAVFNKINRAPLGYIDSTPHGDIINRIVNDTDYVADGLIQGISQLFTGVFAILGTLGFMLSINPLITAIVVCLTPLSLFVASFITRRSHNTFRRQSELQSEISGYAEEIIGNQRVIKAFGIEDKTCSRFEDINCRLYTQGLKAQIYSSFANPSTRFVNSIVYAAVAVIGGISCIGGGISVGQISALLTYANQYTKPFNEITGILSQIQTAFASARRLFDILDAQEEPSGHQGRKLQTCRGDVGMHSVYFSYEEDRPLIEDLNLTVKKGDRVAIVGPTGSGKTTIINILMRFYDINSGEIQLDGNNITQLSRSSLRGNFGMVLQDTWLFSGTIKENIAYGNPAASQEEIIAAAKAAHAHSFIKRMTNGYNTIISEDGANISAGQKQLLCIARIMLTHPNILVLDEATSSIDTLTETQIQRSFLSMMEGRTSFIVAHRLSTIRSADIILVMNKGKIIEQGAHEDLLVQKGFYYELYSGGKNHEQEWNN